MVRRAKTSVRATGTGRLCSGFGRATSALIGMCNSLYMTQSNSENSTSQSTKSAVVQTVSRPTKPRPGDRHKGALLRLWCDPKLHKTWAGKTREHRALLAFASEARLTPVEIRYLLSELMSAARFIGSGPDGTDTYRANAVAAINKYLK